MKNVHLDVGDPPGVRVDHLWIDDTDEFRRYARMGDIMYFQGRMYLYGRDKIGIAEPTL